MRRLLALMLAAGIAGAAAAAPPDRARLHFQLHCMGCHAEDGTGLRGKVPSLAESLPVFLASTQGREFIVRVPGVSQSALSSEELAAVLNWVVREFGGEGATSRVAPFTSAEVERLRTRPLLDVRGTRARVRSLAAPESR